MNATKTQLYRVVSTTSTDFGSKVLDTTIMWEGTDTDELSRAYPPSDIMFADPFDQKEIEDGFIITRFTFEHQLADGSWEQIDDPRRRLTPITAYERAIDEENRRLFPGDYITSDCENCGDAGCDECEDPYGVDCKNCDDYGCAQCVPNWCTACDNNGCAICDPENVCPSCQQYCDPQYESLGKDSGLCQNCEYFAKLCVQCGRDEYDGEDRLCGDCRSQNEWEATTKCSDCQLSLPDGDDGRCSYCRTACPNCGALVDNPTPDMLAKLCPSCKKDEDDMIRDMERYEHWYWRLLWRITRRFKHHK